MFQALLFNLAQSQVHHLDLHIPQGREFKHVQYFKYAQQCRHILPHLDQHVPQWEEIAVLEVLNVNHSPWIFSSSALFPTLTLDDRV